MTKRRIGYEKPDGLFAGIKRSNVPAFNRQRWIIVAGIGLGLYFQNKIKKLEEEVELLRKD